MVGGAKGEGPDASVGVCNSEGDISGRWGELGESYED